MFIIICKIANIIIANIIIAKIYTFVYNSIKFNGRPNMSHKIIDTLKSLALRKLRIDFNHRIDNIKEEYDFYGFDEDISFTAIDLKNYKFLNN